MKDIFQTAGGIAGIGGLAIAFITIVFKGLITDKFFSKLTREQAYKTSRLIIITSFSIAALGIAAFIFSPGKNPVTKKNDSAPGQNATSIGEKSPAIISNGGGTVNISFGDETPENDSLKKNTK